MPVIQDSIQTPEITVLTPDSFSTGIATGIFPIELINTDSIVYQNPDSLTVSYAPPPEIRYEGIARIENPFLSTDWITIILLVQFFAFGFSIQTFFRQMKGLFKSVSQTTDLSHQTILFTGKENFNTICLYLFAELNIGLFLFLAFRFGFSLQWSGLLIVIGIILAFFLLKYIIFKILGFIFFNKSFTWRCLAGS